MRKDTIEKTRFFTQAGIIVFIFLIGASLAALSPHLGSGEPFYRRALALYLFLFAPLNIFSWIFFSRLGGMSILLLSCLSVVFIVLRQGVFYYNGFVVLYGVSGYIGYRIFLRQIASRGQLLAAVEAEEAHKNTLSISVAAKEKNIEASRDRVQRYAALKGVIENLSSILDIEETGRCVTEKAFSVIGRSDRSILFLIDEDLQRLKPLSCKQPDGVFISEADLLERWILKQRRGLIIEDLDSDFRFSPHALAQARDAAFKSTIAAPLISENRITGVLRLDSLRRAAYAQDDLRLLNIVADLAAVSVENSKLYRQTGELALRDGLTGLYVQRHFREQLEARLKSAGGARGKISVLMIDFDYFKNYNDKYGHAAGDLLLKKVANLLEADAGPGRLIARYGGEEFAEILPDTDKGRAILVAEGIRRKVEETFFTLRRDRIKLTVSIGEASFPEDADSAEGIIKKADENLYVAKQSGRNMVWPRHGG